MTDEVVEAILIDILHGTSLRRNFRARGTKSYRVDCDPGDVELRVSQQRDRNHTTALGVDRVLIATWLDVYRKGERGTLRPFVERWHSSRRYID